jgi:hypothetical protein
MVCSAGHPVGAEAGVYAGVTAGTGTGVRRAPGEQLFAASYPRLAAWVRRLVDDDETAQEIASEAFVRLLSKRMNPDKLDKPQCYLYMIATKLARDQWRKTERERGATRSVSAGAVRGEPRGSVRELGPDGLGGCLDDDGVVRTGRHGPDRSGPASEYMPSVR